MQASIKVVRYCRSVFEVCFPAVVRSSHITWNFQHPPTARSAFTFNSITIFVTCSEVSFVILEEECRICVKAKRRNILTSMAKNSLYSVSFYDVKTILFVVYTTPKWKNNYQKITVVSTQQRCVALSISPCQRIRLISWES